MIKIMEEKMEAMTMGWRQWARATDNSDGGKWRMVDDVNSNRDGSGWTWQPKMGLVVVTTIGKAKG